MDKSNIIEKFFSELDTKSPFFLDQFESHMYSNLSSLFNDYIKNINLLEEDGIHKVSSSSLNFLSDFIKSREKVADIDSALFDAITAPELGLEFVNRAKGSLISKTTFAFSNDFVQISLFSSVSKKLIKVVINYFTAQKQQKIEKKYTFKHF